MAETTSNVWTELFGGHKLIKHEGGGIVSEVDASNFGSHQAVLLYFSAHWCPPCRGFTPELVKYYQENKTKFNFEVVFISSDKDEKSFNDYWHEMGWLALPYSARDHKAKLSSKYKVQGIPSLIVLDPKGDVITLAARAKVSSDPQGFPWVPKTFWEILAGDEKSGKKPHLLTNGEKTVDPESLKSLTAVGVYFSAHWCGPCRAFTPKLVETYNKIKADGKQFEIIFASSDKSEETFKDYFKEMPWLAFPYGVGENKDSRISILSDLYDVEGIPSLIIVDPATGKVINDDGRSAVSGDPTGADFPWHPKPLNHIDSAGNSLNDSASFIYLDENLSDETTNVLKTVATAYWDKWKAQGKESMPLHFYYGKTGGLVDRVRQFAAIQENPGLLILNIPEGTKVIISGEEKPTEQWFKSQVDEWESGKSKTVPLK